MMRLPALVLVTGLLLVACGGEGMVIPLPRSTLPTEVPSVTYGRLIDALPKPVDLGPGWEFDVDSLDYDDMIASIQRGYPKYCEWADPAKAGISAGDATHVISGDFTSPGRRTISVSVMVNSPARTAERFAYLRRVAQKCTEITFTRAGDEYVRTLTVLPDPKIDADESLAFTFAEKGGEHPQRGKWACSRTGGLAICIAGVDNLDGALTASMTRARTALGL
jgi:hypothetical protein